MKPELRDRYRGCLLALECVEACRLFGAILYQALSGADKQTILLGHGQGDFQSEKILAIARGEYLAKEREQIRGTGYVVECLEAPLWCFHRSTNFEDAILMAANLGGDSDTTAAVCGQVAGAYYGEGGIPSNGWIAWPWPTGSGPSPMCALIALAFEFLSPRFDNFISSP